MSSEGEKLLQRMKQSKTGWKRRDVETLYNAYGFEIVSGRGPHDKVTHPKFPQLITSLPRHRRVHEYIVVQAIKMIGRLNQLEEESEEDESDE